MEITIRELTDRRARLVLDATSAPQVNALRRVLLSDVPKMAIEEVEFHLGSIRDEAKGKDYDSATSLFDESISLRMGLLPVPTDLKQFRFKDQCSCKGEGCPSCQIVYSVDRKGPCTVYSRDVVPLGDPSLAIREPDIPVVRLGANQALLVYATAQLGTAREHAKWQVATAVGFHEQPRVKVARGKGCTEACLKNVAEVCPPKVFEMKDGKLEVVREDDCIFCHACEEACEHASVTVGEDNTRFHFELETDSSMTSREAIRFSLQDLKRRFDEMRESVLAIP